MHWIKEHPYLSGGLALLLVVLYFVFRGASSGSSGGSSSGQSGPSDSVQTAQIQAGAGLQALQAQLTAQQSQLNAQVAVSQINANRDITVKQMDVQSQLQNIVTSGQVQNFQNDAALQSVKAQVGGQVSIADINANRDIQLTGIQGDVLKQQSADAVASQKIISDAQTAQAGLTTAALMNQQNRAADIAYTQLVTGADIAKTQITEAGAVEINQQNRNADVAYTNIVQSADVQKTGILAGAQTQQAGIAAQQNVDLATIAAQYGIDMSQLQNQHDVDTSITQFLQSGGFNKGGAGGQNQVQVVTGLFGINPMPGAPETSGGFNIGVSNKGFTFGVGGSQG